MLSCLGVLLCKGPAPFPRLNSLPGASNEAPVFCYTRVVIKHLRQVQVSAPAIPDGAQHSPHMELLKQNRNLVGWIKIEQTTVDYPDVSGARVLSAKNCEETLKKSIP